MSSRPADTARPPTPPHPEGRVLAERRGGLAIATLSRPQALNALTLAMVRELAALLRAWRDDAGVQCVLLRGAPRGDVPCFCAGGDIRFIRQAALDGDPRLDEFFTEEYRLDHLIHRFPKPLVAWLDGVVMGGGMGVSQGAALRIATEHAQLAMPETLIGFFPDVGGGWFLGRCPGHVGEYLALTGVAVGAADAIAFGLADAHLPSARADELIEMLAAQAPHGAEGVLAGARALAVAPPAPQRAQPREAIDHHFGQPDLAAIVRSLEADQADGSDFARETLAALRLRSPLMLAVTLEQVRRARRLTLAEALRMERDLAHNAFRLDAAGSPVAAAASEPVEGIRALAVDKDRAPRWRPARIEELDTAAALAAHFASPWPVAAHPLRDLKG